MTETAIPAVSAVGDVAPSPTRSNSYPGTVSKSRSPQDMPPMTGARIFVGIIFVLLGASFIASTAVLIREFWEFDWPALLLLHSHLFIFFPTLGLLALAAFHLPATVFTHMYWTQIKHGKLRFCLGTLVAFGLTAAFSLSLFDSGQREVWEIAPRVLDNDRSEPARCGGESGIPCKRVSILGGIGRLRTEAQTRIGLSKFTRVCEHDPLLEIPDDVAKVRFCFAADVKLDGNACCSAQKLYASRIHDLWAVRENRSQSAAFDRIALPLKTFFVIVVILIGVFLVVWRKLLESFYAKDAPAIERSLLVGAAAMLPWPFMDYAFLQAMQTLIGRSSPSPQPRLSLVIGPWALLLLIFFLARMGRKIERLGQLAGAIASVIAVLRYEDLNDIAVRVFGVGAPLWMVGALVLFALVCLVSLLRPARMERAMTKAMGPRPQSKSSPST